MGIVRKKKGISNKNKNNLGNGISNGINNSYSLQNGGSKKPGHVNIGKRDSSQTISKSQKVSHGITEGAKSLSKLVSKPLFVAPAIGLSLARTALVSVPYATAVRTKAAVQSAIPKAKEIYQKRKLNQSQRKLNRVTGEDVYKSYQAKQAKLIADYQKKKEKYGSVADGGKKLGILNTSFKKQQEKLNTSLEKRVTGESMWSKFFKPFTPKSDYKMSPEDFAEKIKSLKNTADPLKVTNFSEIIKEKQKAYNQSQTQKKEKKTENITGKQKEKAFTVQESHNRTKTLLNKSKTMVNSLKTKFDLLKNKPTLKMTNNEKQTYFKERNTALRTLQVAEGNFKRDELEHKKSEKLLDKAKKELIARQALANKKTSKKQYYTTQNMQNSINRRSARLNTTKKKLDNIRGDANRKVKRSFQKSDRIYEAVKNWTDFKYTEKRKEYNAKVANYKEKKAARKTNRQEKQKLEVPGFFSKVKTAITPNMLQGADKLQKPVEHIEKLTKLKGDIDSIDAQLIKINPDPNNPRNFDLEKQRLIAEGKTLDSNEIKQITNDQEKYNKFKIDKTKILFQFKERQTKLLEITKELEKRTTPEKIEQTINNINKMKDIPTELKDDTGKIKSLDNIDMKTIGTLLENAKTNKNTYNYNLFEQLYKHKKNLDAIKQFREETQIGIPKIQKPINDNSNA
jgi:hypothetical protein